MLDPKTLKIVPAAMQVRGVSLNADRDESCGDAERLP
jgi:hypothetical protein